MLGRLLFIAVAVIAFALDRATKLMVEAQMQLGERINLIGDDVALRYVHNRGIAFGLFSGAGALVVIGSLVVGALLFTFLLRVKPSEHLTIVGGALITGGAIGNLVDRVQMGYVIDFLQLPRWPTFNVADICIVGGVGLVLLGQLHTARREQAAATAAAGDVPCEDAAR